jgi:hypothetical protein
MKRLIITLALILAAATPAFALCDASPVTVNVLIPQTFAQQNELLNGGAIDYTITAQGTTGATRAISLDVIANTETVQYGTSLFTLPSVNTIIKGRTLKSINSQLDVRANTMSVCISVFAHPNGADCGSPEERAAVEVGRAGECIVLVIP